MRNYNFNENYFELIDSQEKAYWLGFIAADGYLNARQNTIGICLDILDKEHLQKFLKAIGESDNKLKYRKVQFNENYKFTEKVTIEFYSKKMDKDLRKLGLTHTKSNTLKPLNNIPEPLIPHFIRGYFDGDGCVFEHYIKYGKKKEKLSYSPGFTFVGTYKFLQFINNNLPVKAKTLKKDNRTIGSYTLYLRSMVRFRKVYKYLYNDSTVYLDRKYRKSKFIMNNIEKSSTTKREIPNQNFTEGNDIV